MQQVVLSYLDGDVNLVELPTPSLRPGHILVKSRLSLISAGTEKMLIDFGRAGFHSKVLSQKDKVKALLDKAITDGPISALEAANHRLASPQSLGYSVVGTVVKVAPDVLDFKPGDRVICNGPHAEYVTVPVHLAALVPNTVPDEQAVYTVVGAIALQGIRLAQPTFGETFLVQGLGLIGMLTCELLRANGCCVLGYDPDPRRSQFAAEHGVEVIDPSSDTRPNNVSEIFGGESIDGSIICASTSSSDPVSLAANACRKRGRIILVGVSGLNLSRSEFYEKELQFQVSCSYGPGRYDPAYENYGHDYPIGFVRWTEQRNFGAFLQALSSQSLSLEYLTTSRFSLSEVSKAYDLLSSSDLSYGILLDYSQSSSKCTDSVRLSSPVQPLPNQPVISFLGVGNYASRVLIPSFAKAGCVFSDLSSSSNALSYAIASRFGFRSLVSDYQAIINQPSSNAVVITTRHDTHSELVLKSLHAGKHVFVEKPLCLNIEDLNQIEDSYTGKNLLMVGFNRRFAPLVLALKAQLTSFTGPKAFVYTCNSGNIPANHWSQDKLTGGGRLIGEACHFVDLLRYLADSPIDQLQLLSAADTKPCPDTFSLHMRFHDGSIGTVHYFSNGSRSFPKERLEVFCSGKILQLDNYRKLKGWGIPGFRTRRLLAQDKGQVACCSAFLKAIETGSPPPIPVSEIFEVQRRLLEVSAL